MDNGDIRQDLYYCKCGLNFSSMASLQAHWDDPTRDKSKRHYRANADGADYSPREDNLSDEQLGPPMPPIHKDGPQ